ncbi:Cmx/CmrA family chloramphenicol efflux MFS transporter, partial [Streptomyces sp. A012304]|uniref:Cmx/CmrA family chloramphenicol efflux MFS transporter n=1 Tax=Streptomyces sp. A012304 TaxID=375446 RepID=UPI0022322B2D
MPLPLYLLALAVFAMGTSEFMLAGLLPDIASDLDVTVGTAGVLTSAFAIGMIVGAPLVAALARNWPRRSSLLGFVLAFAAAHAVGAITTSFPVLFATRVVAALANAGFLAVALTAAARLVPADQKGRALAVLLSGTTVATIAGVPGGSVLGTLLGWRATFWAVAALCLPAALGILKAIPAGRAKEEAAGGPTLRAEFAQLARPRLLLVMLLGALVNSATFASFTFLAPVVTDTAGLGELWISVALVLFGAGSLVGVTVAGRLSDQRPALVLTVGGPLLLIGWPAPA